MKTFKTFLSEGINHTHSARAHYAKAGAHPKGSKKHSEHMAQYHYHKAQASDWNPDHLEHMLKRDDYLEKAGKPREMHGG